MLVEENSKAGYLGLHRAKMIPMHWLNEPNRWKEADGVLTITVDPQTDFWRVTHYGFVRDNGAFYFTEHTGDFEAQVRVLGDYRELYHQAGLMIRIDEMNWIKAGIEYVEGVQNLSAVVTREFSDWSVIARQDSPEFAWLKLLRKGDFVQIDYSFDNEKYNMLRLAYFPPDATAQIGMMAAAPGEQGFAVRFDHFKVRPL
jgi:uncharacterized protein